MSNRLREILGQLLAFDTTSRESNLALIAWIGDFLRARGVTSQLFYDDEGRKDLSPACWRRWRRF